MLDVQIYEGHRMPDITMRDRPDSPYGGLHPRTRDLRRAQGYSGTPLSRHHVIPWNKLKGFWNKLLVDKNSFDTAKPLLDRIAYNVGNYGTQLHPTEIQTVKDVATKIGKSDLDDFTSAGFYLFSQVYAWLPGNLFEGPGETYRGDDPGDEFDSKAGSIMDARQFNLLQTAYKDIADYVDTRNPKESAGPAAIAKLKSLAEMPKITKLNPDNWARGKLTIVRGGKLNLYSIRATKRVSRAVSDIPTASHHAALAATPDPAGQIKIGDKTITLTVVDNDGKIVYERGTASDISFRELADWAAAQFGAEVPEELTSITIRYFGADVFSTQQERTIQFVIVIDFQLNGTTVDMMVDLVCTRTNNSSTAFVLRLGTAITLSDDNYLWFDGVVRRANAPTSALASTYGNESPE